MIDLDSWLPDPQVRGRHRCSARATPAELWHAAGGVRVGDAPTLGRAVRCRDYPQLDGPDDFLAWRYGWLPVARRTCPDQQPVAGWIPGHEPLGHLLQLHSRRLEAPLELDQVALVVHDELEPLEAARPFRRRRRTGARPGVHTDVVVVAAGGEKQGAGIAANGHVESERAGIEGLRFIEVGDVQVNVADARSRG